MKIKTISNNMIISYTILTIILVFSLLTFFNKITREKQLIRIKKNMNQNINLIDRLFVHNLPEDSIEISVKIKKKINSIAKIIDLRITFINLSGKVIYDSEVIDVNSMDNHYNRTEIQSSIDKGSGESIRYSKTIKTNMLYYGKRTGNIIIRLAKPLFEIDKSLKNLNELFLHIGIFVIISAILIIVLVSKKITSPINETIKFAQQFSNGDFSKRIEKYSNNEIGILQKSLNEFADTILHDMTEKKKIEQIKTDLIGNMSHELKTPIAIINGYLETIDDNIENTSLVKDFLKKTLLNVNRLNSIINDILKLNQIESSKNFLFDKINLVEIIENCIEILSPRALGKKIKIINEIKIHDINLFGNRFLAEEIFFNLIDNAINYNNEKGFITIESKKNDDTLNISISDTGIGIPQDSMDRIFERFYRIDKSRSRATGGTGLGLSIVKHAVELLGWKIGLSSNEKGTVFTLRIALNNGKII